MIENLNEYLKKKYQPLKLLLISLFICISRYNPRTLYARFSFTADFNEKKL